MGSTTFTAKQDSILRRMWKEGDTTRRIAEVLGAGLTRNSIIGRAHRLNLPSRKSPIKRASTSGKKRRPMTFQQRERKRELERERARAEGAVPRPAGWGAKAKAIKERRAAAIIAPAPATGSMSFSQAAIDNKCMWPYGDLKAGGNVCGGDLAEGSRSWCASHAAVAVHGSKVETGAGDEQQKADGAVA